MIQMISSNKPQLDWLAFLRDHGKHISLFLVTCCFLFLFGESITGIHGDEGWTLLRTAEFEQGKFSLDGMNDYTGLLFSYLLFPFFKVFGYQLWVLRGVSAFLNLVALILAMRTVDYVYPKSSLGIWMAWLLGTSTFFVCFARFGIEVTALTPMLSMAGVYLIVTGVHGDGSTSEVRLFFSGVFMGLSIYNHIVAITLPMAIAAACILVYRKRFFNLKILGPVLLGLVLFANLRLFSIAERLEYGSGSQSLIASILRPFQQSFWDLPNLFSVQLKLLNGEILFQRFSGELFVAMFPYFGIGAVVLLLGRALLHPVQSLSHFEKVSIVTFFFLILSIGLVTPRYSLRFFALPGFVALFLLVILSRLLLEDSRRWVSNSAKAILAAMICLNIFFVSTNYFLGFERYNTVVTFPVGNRLVETNSHFFRTDGLYNYLVEEGVQQVLVDDFIYQCLQYHNFKDEKLEVLHRRRQGSTNLMENTAAKTAYVGYWENLPSNYDDELPMFFGKLHERVRKFEPRFFVFVLKKEEDT